MMMMIPVCHAAQDNQSYSSGDALLPGPLLPPWSSYEYCRGCSSSYGGTVGRPRGLMVTGAL